LTVNTLEERTRDQRELEHAPRSRVPEGAGALLVGPIVGALLWIVIVVAFWIL
jgi:hypothetical protein